MKDMIEWQEAKSDTFFTTKANVGYDGYFVDWDEFFGGLDFTELTTGAKSERPEYVWETEAVPFSIDIDNMLDFYTEDLYEDALSDISEEKYKELKDFMSRWCETCGIRETYFPTNRKVRIPWELYEE